ncbi:hypothetical protein [Clostridium sp.]|jgi:hypothetical protein|uniref:hypothetical protein n=1 Tax=Clostridium sp. TaxID=1506 RepID=UPI003EECE57D
MNDMLFQHGIGTNGIENSYDDGSDGILNTIENTTFESSLNGGAIVKKYQSILINIGHIVTVSNPCQGLILYSQGDVIIDGKIDMTAKGGYCNNGSITPLPIVAKDINGLDIFKKYNQITTILQNIKGGNGGNGGDGGIGRYTTSYPTGYAGAGSIGGACRTNLGGFGGGGGGGGFYPYPEGGGGRGGAGGGILYPELGGGRSIVATCSIFHSNYYGTASANGSNGAGGGGGRAGHSSMSSHTSDSNGAGSGGTGGNYSTVLSSQIGDFTGGFLAIIARGNIIINGEISANGGNGGNGGNGHDNYSGGGGGGGGAGGGVIMFLHKGSYQNNGTVSVNGGLGGSGGVRVGSSNSTNGLAGTSGSLGTIHNQQL